MWEERKDERDSLKGAKIVRQMIERDRGSAGREKIKKYRYRERCREQKTTMYKGRLRNERERVKRYTNRWS